MPRNQQYNNTPNGNNQTPRNNGQYNNHNNNNNNNNRQYNNGSNNRGRQNNGSFNNRPFNNGQNSNTPSYNGPQNGNQRFIGPHNNNPRKTAFYNRVSHNGNNNNNNQRNCNPSNNFNGNGNQRNGNLSNNNNNNSGTANNSNNTIINGNTNGNTNGNNGNLREGITQSTSPGGGQPEGHVTINNTVVTHPTPPTRVLDTPRRKSLASRKAEEDRNRLMKQICDYYGISSIRDLLKEPDHAPEEWDNLLLNKIYWLRDHNLDLQETRDALSNQIRTRLRKATKRSDKPAKPYLLAQDIEALNKDIVSHHTLPPRPPASLYDVLT
ncbi:hypothetical protein LZ30DRAFT_356543 [Colletotrichum cereale]|nr:hypothetical protein LZ30DRAFT_356543 [Colletotrichum cereale]